MLTEEKRKPETTQIESYLVSPQMPCMKGLCDVRRAELDKDAAAISGQRLWHAVCGALLRHVAENLRENLVFNVVV